MNKTKWRRLAEKVDSFKHVKSFIELRLLFF